MPEQDCDMCGGSGRCNFVAHGQGPDKNCLECGGSMKCRKCNGTGKLR